MDAAADARGIPYRVYTVGLGGVDHIFSDCSQLRGRAAFAHSRAGLGAGRPKVCRYCLVRFFGAERGWTARRYERARMGR